MLQKVYLEYRIEFVRWAQTGLNSSEAEAKSIYQDVIEVFYTNIAEGKITRLKSNLKTYLFGIGKILIRKQFRKEIRYQTLDASEDWKKQMKELSIEHTIELTERQEFLRIAVNRLGGVCKKLLILFYYRKFSTESIMNELGYENTDVVKSQKSRCMRSLRKLVNDKFKTELQ